MNILRKTTKSISLLAMFYWMSTMAFGQQSNIITMEGNKINSSTLSSEIKRIMQQENIPGLSIAIINQNKLAYHEVFGVTNTETGELVSKESIFEGASLSKPIFAYFVLKLAEEGLIDLDKPLHEYLPHPGIAPESQEDYKLITARMVLSHQTGFPNHAYNELITLKFKPGTGFSYSGEAYQYLAAVIAVQKGINMGNELNELFQRNVTFPLRMEHSTFVWDDYLTQYKVYGHDENSQPTQNKPGPGRWSGKSFNAFSSLHSEAFEYAKFIIAILNREGLCPSTFDDMLKEQTHFTDDNPLRQEVGQTGWGLGFTQKKTSEWTMHLHTGNNHDFQSFAMFVPEKEYGLVIFTNSPKMESFLKEFSKVVGPVF